MSRSQKAILGGAIAGLGLGIAIALILYVALTQLTLSWEGSPTPFPSDVLATFLSLVAGVSVGLGGGIMVASLIHEDVPPPSS